MRGLVNLSFDVWRQQCQVLTSVINLSALGGIDSVSAGIHDFYKSRFLIRAIWRWIQFKDGGDAIASHTRSGVDDGNAASSQSIKQAGLADVRSTNDCQAW